MDKIKPVPGDVLFLEHEIAGIPYPTGYWVLLWLTDSQTTVSLVSQNKQGLYAIDNPYTIWREDLSAFKPTGERAVVPDRV